MRKTIIFLLFAGLITQIHSVADDASKKNNIHQIIQEKSEKIFPDLVKIRRDIHQNPELSGQEKRTSRLVRDYLFSLGLEVKTNIGGYGVVGILNSNKPGPVLAWRADMDALQDTSPDPVEFKSKIPGVRHTCGHDVHTTIALGMARVISDLKDQIRGTVVFIFQPSEENFQGAKRMIKEGLLDMVKPDAIFALHVGPLPCGVVSAKAEEMFAYRYSRIRIKFKNVEDDSEVKREVVRLIQDLDTHPGTNIFNIQPDDKNTGVFSPQSILKDYFKIPGNVLTKKEQEFLLFETRVFCSSARLFNKKLKKLKETLSSVKWKTKLDNITHSHIQPVVFNNPDIFKKSLHAIQAVYGKESFLPLHGVIPLFNDDFALFQQKIPGVYFFLGASDFEKGIVSMPHTPNFMVDENSIKIGIKYFSSMIVELLGH